MSIAKKIREFREYRKLSQAQLAKNAGLSTPYISMIENGQKSPTLKSLEKISKALDIPFPILSFLSLNPEDIKSEGKKEAYINFALPAINKMIEEIFLNDK